MLQIAPMVHFHSIVFECWDDVTGAKTNYEVPIRRALNGTKRLVAAANHALGDTQFKTRCNELFVLYFGNTDAPTV